MFNIVLITSMLGSMNISKDGLHFGNGMADKITPIV